MPVKIEAFVGKREPSTPQLVFNELTREQLAKINLLSVQKMKFGEGRLILIRNRGTVIGVAEATRSGDDWNVKLNLLRHRLQPERPRQSERNRAQTILGMLERELPEWVEEHLAAP